MIYPSNLIQTLIQGIIVFIVTIIMAIFSPFGVGFIIFSAIRAKTKNSDLRTVSLIFQIILSILTLVVGIAIGLFLLISRAYFYGTSWVAALAVIIGAGFVFAIELGILIWQGSLLKNKPR